MTSKHTGGWVAAARKGLPAGPLLACGSGRLRVKDVLTNEQPVPAADHGKTVCSDFLADLGGVGGDKIRFGIEPQFRCPIINGLRITTQIYDHPAQAGQLHGQWSMASQPPGCKFFGRNAVPALEQDNRLEHAHTSEQKPPPPITRGEQQDLVTCCVNVIRDHIRRNHQRHRVQKHAVRNDLDAYWMPFTPNKAFKAAPRMVAGAEGQFYLMSDGRRIQDGFSGMR